MYFAVTVTKNRRDGFDEDMKALKTIIECFKRDHYEVGYVGFEIQEDPKQHHCLHFHTLITGKKPPFMNKYRDLFKMYGMQWDLKELEGEQDIYRWCKYCHKGEQNIPYIYSETGSVPSKRIFKVDAPFSRCCGSPTIETHGDCCSFLMFPKSDKDEE